MKTLREHRRTKLMSIEDLSQAADVSTKTVVDTELGRTTPKLRTIKKISEALGIDAMEIQEFAIAIEEDDGSKKLAA